MDHALTTLWSKGEGLVPEAKAARHCERVDPLRDSSAPHHLALVHQELVVKQVVKAGLVRKAQSEISSWVFPLERL